MAAPFLFRAHNRVYYGRKLKEDDDMSKEEIIKMIESIDEQLEVNGKKGATYIPTTRLLVDLRNWWVDILLREYGVFYN